jgi:predicted exporter
MKIFSDCYRCFENRRRWLILALLLLLLLCGWQLSRLQLEENISALLPDGNSVVANDFQLLQQAPFARKLVVNLRAASNISTDQLLDATDALRDALPPELFENALSGPGAELGLALLNELGQYLPLLADTEDLQRIDERLAPNEIDRRLQIALSQLLQPQGVALKEKIRRDPLGLESIALEKLRHLNPVPEVRLERGHFLSKDGRNTLILADTSVAITDSRGSQELLAAFATARHQLPPGINAELVSGHAYTQANATTIQKDMSRVLIASGVGVLLLFLLFLRSIRALFVYLLPLFSFAVALLVCVFVYDQVSGITIGFGAVLLGITIDFGLHVYFALRKVSNSTEETLRAVARPVLFGALTSLAAFSVLLSSELPGQRQLALFAMAGIASALILALVFLPHFLGKQSENRQVSRLQIKPHIYTRVPLLRVTILMSWFVITLVAAFQIQQLSINGDLRKLSYQSETIRQNEADLAAAWGNMRGRALIFAKGKELQSALRSNEQVWQLLKSQDQTGIVSLAPLLPTQETMQTRRDIWQDFWVQRRAAVEESLIKYGHVYGFSAAAFEPFWSQIQQPPDTFGVAQLQQLGFQDLLDNLLLEDENGYQVISLLPDNPELILALEGQLASLPGVTLVSQSRFGRQLSREIGADFNQFILSAGLAVLFLLLVLFRRIRPLLLALLPVLTGLVVMFGAMAWLGLELNLFNVVASILIIGLGVDYGIFMVCHGQQQQQQELASARAVLVSGLTTLVGFGALVLAEHPALHSIGLTVLLGISAAVPTAVLVIPAFQLKRP